MSDDDAVRRGPGALTELPEDRSEAGARAALAMREGRYEDALVAADEAILALLHDGLTLDDFLRFSQRGAHGEGLMRFEQSMIAALPRLHEPLAIRWEALRRTGRLAEAREMRAVCLRHFGGRASVWATAGNQALDEGDLNAAQRYFDGCLRLSPDWTAGLVGTAIVFESRRDWQAALRYRQRVVEVSRALIGQDAPSLQRVLRYAAALGRVGRWQDARPLFRRCASLGAFATLPAERPVMLRVFSRELYAPSVVAALQAQAPEAFAVLSARDPEVAFALQQLQRLATVYRSVERIGAPAGEALMMLGSCAWLAGDEAGAHALFDEAEVHREGDLVIHYMLVATASAADAPDRAGIDRFAIAALRATQLRALQSQALEADTLLFARLIGAYFSLASPELDAIWQVRAAGSELLRACDMAPAAPDVPCPKLPVVQGQEPSQQLRNLLAFAAAQRGAGHSALDTARASSHALAALQTCVEALSRA